MSSVEISVADTEKSTIDDLTASYQSFNQCNKDWKETDHFELELKSRRIE
jgi:hypothetical protein